MDKITEQFERLREQGTMRDIDIYFAAFICETAGTADPGLYLAAAMASWAVGRNNICFDMAAYAGQEFPPQDEREHNADFIVLPEYETWVESLRQYPSVIGFAELNPLVVDGTRLYLKRYWDYETSLSDAILARSHVNPAYEQCKPQVKAWLEACFPTQAAGRTDMQKMAAFAALRNRISIISGGPGTGKTFTAARILALLIERELHAKPGHKPRILMAAPTGKAAARLKESVQAAKNAPRESVTCMNIPQQIKDLIPEDAQTIHRMLGAIPGSSRFRHRADNPLTADILLIDEASMIPLPLMTRIFDAMPPESSLVLLGDMNQLSSVEPGYVYGDICAAAQPHCFTGNFIREYAEVIGSTDAENLADSQATAISDSAVQLTESRRFPPGSPIDLISRAVNSANSSEAAETAFELVKSADDQTVVFTQIPSALYNTDRRVMSALRNLIIDNFRAYLNAATPAEAFREFDRFRILCALRQGPFGVVELNRIVEEVLSFRHTRSGTAAQSGINRPIEPEQQYYHRQPIMILRNDYNLKLFNGDIGIIYEVEAENGTELRAFFRLPSETPEAGEQIESFSLAALPEHETVFAMTVHKSQGSEFNRLLFVLPPEGGRIVTRELIYTGITRAKEQVMLWTDEAAFKLAVQHRTERSSGLQEKLLVNINR